VPDEALVFTSDEADGDFTSRTEQIDQPGFKFPPKRERMNTVNGPFVGRPLVAHV
jgi:hypothetical protein